MKYSSLLFFSRSSNLMPKLPSDLEDALLKKKGGEMFQNVRLLPFLPQPKPPPKKINQIKDFFSNLASVLTLYLSHYGYGKPCMFQFEVCRLSLALEQ